MTLYDKKREVPESLRRYAEERRASEKRKQQNKEDEASVSSSIWKENESAVSSSQRREAPAALRKYAEERRASEQRVQQRSNLANNDLATSTPSNRLSLLTDKQRETIEKFSGRTYTEIDEADTFGEKWDNFWEQAKASKDMGRISQDVNDAYSEYLKNPTEENRAYAEALAQLERDFSTRNADVLDDEDVVWSWISQSAAGYLPQLWDQTKAGAVGALGGGAAGAAVGSVIPGIGTATGAVTGAKAGIVAGVGKYSYDSMKGAAYRGLIEAGVDDETARKAANDEAIISALIEMADTGVDIATLGVGKLLTTLGKGGVKAVAGEAAEGAAKKLLKGLLGYGVNVVGEMGEEAAQEAVSIANKERQEWGATGVGNLAGSAMGVGLGALYSGVSEDENAKENAAQIWEAAAEGGKIAAIMGGATKVGNTALNTAVTAKQGANLRNTGDETVQALVESGLESAPETESHRLAQSIQSKRAAGKTVTAYEVGKLQQANEAAIRAEATETAPETLEDVAREVVTRDAKSAQAASQQAKSVPYNVMSVDNPARQAVMAQKQRSEDYANALGYGEHGRAALQSISEQAEVSMEQANTEFHLPYLRGLSNMDLSEADVTSDTQLKAFNAGKLDRIQSMNLDAEKSAFATVHGKESGLVQSTASKKLDKKAVAVLNKASKAFGTKTMLVDEIWQKDGKIVPKGTEGAAEADAAMQSNGVMLVSLNAGDPLYTLTKHEFTHRFQQLAPAEYQQYRDAVMQYVVAGDAVAATSTVEGYQNRLGLNVNRSADEIAADFSAYILKDVKEASRFFDSLLDPKKNTVEQVKKNRTMLERFMDAARAFVQKIKQAFGGDKSKMDAAAQEAFGGTVEQLQELEKLWKQAAQASAKVVQEKVETSAKQEYTGANKNDAMFSRKGYWRSDLTSAQMKDLISWVKYDIKTSENSICDTANWTFRKFEGLPVFAIYSTQNESDPTILYEVKGEQAEFERNILKHTMEAINYGESVDGKSVVIDKLLSRSWVRKAGGNRDGNGAVGRGRSAGDAGVLRQQSERRPSAAFESVLRNLLKDQQSKVTGGDALFSMKKDSNGNALTKEQQEYFKDSKVRDENGNLKVMYHGTKKYGFNIFDYGRQKFGLFGGGFYFTDDRSVADGYSKDSDGNAKDTSGIYEVYLNVTKPIDMDAYADKEKWVSAIAQTFDEYPDVVNKHLEELIANRSEQMNGARETIKNSDMFYIMREVMYDQQLEKWEAAELATDCIRSMGFDGITHVGGGRYNFGDKNRHRVYIAFDQEQIKRTDNVNPTDHPDIRFSMKKGVDDYQADLEAAKRELEELRSLSLFDRSFDEATEILRKRDRQEAKIKRIERKIKELSAPVLENAGTLDSKAFKVWFGDWRNGKGSKVVDENGKPLIVYHGTGTTIEEFLPEFTGKGVDQYGSGFYFTSFRSTAEGYQTRTLNDQEKPGGMDSPNVIPVYLNIRHPIVVNAAETPHLYNFDVSPTMAARIIAKCPGIMDPEESILGDYIDEYWERGPQRYMITRLANEYDWTLGSLETDLFRDYPTEFRQAVKDVLGYDGVQVNFNSGEKHFVAWFPNQIKHATENSGAFSKGDNRIKFSMKGQGDLLAENAKLREVNAELREQFKTTKFAKVDKKSLDAFAKKLLKDYQSGADINETRDALDALYTYIANGENGEAPVWQEAYKRAYDTAVEILEQSSELDDQLYQEYKALRDEMRTRGIHLAKEYTHDLAGWESINEFRKAHLGSIKMTNDGTPVDVVYQDLANRYPEFFNEDEYNNPADQLLHIAEVLDSLKPAEVNRYAYNMRESATWMANDIMERFYELPQAKPTFADKAQQKLTKQVIHDAKKLERLRAEKNERIAQVIKREKERTGEVRKKEREKRSKAVKQVKEYYLGKQAAGSERRNSAVLRKRIAQHASDLSKKLLRPTDAQHIPENLRTTVAAVLEAINLESQFTIDPVTGKRSKGGGGDPVKRTEAFRKLKEVYSKILQQEGADMVIDPSLLGNAEEGFDGYFDAVLGMSDTKLADMSLNQLEIVWRVIRAVERSITTAGKMLASKKFESTVEWADAFEEDTDTKRRLKGSKVEALRLDLENPYTFFAHYGKAGEAVFRMLRDAQDAQQRMVEAVNEEVRKIVDPKQVKQWEKEVHEFKTARGEKLVLTAAHMMEIHELMKREQARDHLTKGGIVQPEIKSKKIRRGTDAVLLSLEDIMQIVGKLTQEQMNVADKLQGLMTGILADYGNEASMRAYGYEKFTGTDYFPIKSAKEGVHSNIEKGGNNSRSIKNIGLAKSVIPHASNALDIGGIFSTFASHAADMADYAAWLCPMEDANRLYNFQFRDEMGQRSGFTMKGLLDRYGGNGAQKYWHNLMEDIQNGISAPSDTTVMNIINKGIGNARAASVGANIRVIVQQPTAFLRAAMVLNPADMVKGMAAAATKGGGWKKALKYSEIAKRKDMGGFDISSPAQMNEILFDSKSNLQKFNDAMMWGAGKADAVTWGKIWNACEWAVKGEGKLETGSDEFYERAAELFAEVIDQSQVVDGVLQRSQLMRSSNALVKQATAFMGEPTMALNMMLRAYDGLRNEQDTKKRGAAFKRFGRAAVVLLTTNVVNAFMQSLVDAWRDDDDDEYWEKVMAAFTGLSGEEESPWEKATAAVLSGNVGESLNPVGYIPFAKDLLSILQGYNVTRADADVMADIVSAWQAFADSMWGDGKKTKSNAVWNLAKQVGKVFGISAPNMTRDIYGMLRTIAQDTGNIAARYELEKWIYQVSNDGNANRFTDILYKAYMEDQDVYQHIYDDMKASGFNMDKIQNRMENNMKRDQNVESVSDLKQRYLHPDQQVEYDRKAAAVQSSHLWKEASGEYRDELEEKLYHLVTDSKTGEELQEKIDEGRSYGLSETDYLLYTLALDMYDQPNKNGELGGTPTNEEKAVAIEALGGLSDGAIAYLWDTKSGYEAYAGGADMGAFVEYIGAGGSVSVEKLLDAKSAGIDDDTYYSFLDMLKEYDEPTEGGTMGTFTQDEATAAVRAMPGLTSEERAFLWQSVNSGWKSKNNPWK